MDELMRRYADLAERLRRGMDGTSGDGLIPLAAEAEAVAAATTSTWLVTQSRSLAAAARLLAGGPAALAPLVVDLAPPSEMPAARVRLDELLPEEASLEARLERHRRQLRVPPGELLGVATELLRLLGDRAREDLELPPRESVELRLAPAPLDPIQTGAEAASGPAHVTHLVLDGSRQWSVDEVLDLVTREAYPGRHVARACRPAMPAWEPSPEASVLRGLEIVGREVLLGDHELAGELDRIARRIGARWSGARVLEVRRALENLVPSVAARVVVGPSVDGPPPALLDALGASTIERRPGMLRGAAWIGRAGAPALLGEWLTVTGQTEGLRRLVREPLVPEQLRREIADAG